MRAEFAQWIARYASHNEDVVFLTGDLGYKALEEVRATLGARFLNVGVSEQNMVSLAAGLARRGLRPLCYSIAPFAVFRPAEQIRLDVCLHGLDVKLVGNGGGYGYGIMGATHHAIDDLSLLSSLQKMRCYLPVFDDDVEGTAGGMMDYRGPSYLRLNNAKRPVAWAGQEFSPIRKWTSAIAARLTVVALGPMIQNCYTAIKSLDPDCAQAVDLFSVSQLPLDSIAPALVQSVLASHNVLVVEEHVVRGGLAEHLALKLHEALSRTGFELHSAAAIGYPDGLYGSQLYHQRRSGLDAESLAARIEELLDPKRTSVVKGRSEISKVL